MRHIRLIAPMLLTAALSGPGFAQEGAADAASAGDDSIVTAHGVSTWGPLALPADFDHLPYVNPDAPKGGELSQWAMGGFDSYNPFTHRGRAGALSVSMLERIMEGVADNPDEMYCLLCETIEYPESRDWVIFNLRPEAAFSDGTPLTAHDVLFSFELLRDKGLSSYRTVISKAVAKAEVLDDHRIKFFFQPDFPRRDVIQYVGGQIVFSRKDFLDNERDLEQSSNLPFIGSGPYMFDKANIGSMMRVRRNPDYWGKDLPINRGRHNYDTIRTEYFGDYDSAFEAFKAGIYTFRNEVSSIHWATRYDFPALKSGAVVQETPPDGNIANGQAWVINLRREKFQDIRVRQAIAMMFNFEWSNDTLFYGLNTRVDSFWANTDLKAVGTPSEAELALLEPVAADLPEGILTEDAVLPTVSGKTQLDRRNLRRAGQLLDEAGWTPGSDGMRRNSKGELLTVEFLNDSVTFDRIINPFVQNLRALGVDASNARVDDAEMTTRTRSHDFDIVTDHLGQSYQISGGTEQYFGSNMAGDVFNAMGLANPAIDALIKVGQEAETAEENRVAISALDRALRSLHFWVPQWYKADYNLAYYDMYEHPADLPAYDLGVEDFWWINSEKADKLKADGALK